MNASYKINGKIIETTRLVLRPFTQSDLAEFFEYAKVEGVGEMAGWPHHESIEKSQEILDGFIAEDKTFAITLKDSGKVVGSLGVEEYGMQDKLTEFFDLLGREVGFVLAKPYWGQGIMAEAVNGLIGHLFNEIGLDFLLCGHYDFNHQSQRVQQKCGFKPYRKLTFETKLGTKEPGVLNLLLNPNKQITLEFSHPETLIYEN